MQKAHSDDRRMAKKFKQLINFFGSLPDVKLLLTDGLFTVFSVENHPPLNRFVLRYITASRFWSKNYTTVISAEKESDNGNGSAWVIFSKFHPVFCGEFTDESIIDRLNRNGELMKCIGDTDILTLTVSVLDHRATVQITTSIGSTSVISVPALCSYIVPKEAESIRLLQILRLILTEI